MVTSYRVAKADTRGCGLPIIGYHVRHKVLTVVTMDIVFWGVTPCSLVDC
jgi:hypothetical protein